MIGALARRAGRRAVTSVAALAGCALLIAAVPGIGQTDLVQPAAKAPAEARLSLGASLGTLPRFGVNLGGRNVWGAEQLLANVLRNPGLEAAFDGALIVVARIDGASVEDDSRWTARPEGFWAGAAFEVLSGPAAGQRGQVLDNRRADARSPDRLTLAPMPAALRPGDTLAVRGLQDPTPAPLWWTQGWLQAVPDPRPGSPGQRAVRLRAVPGQPAALFHHLDAIGERAGKLLPVQGRWRLALWVRGDSADARLQLSFGRHGRPAWLNQGLSPGRRWQRVDLVFDPRDDGPPGPLQLSISALQGEVLVDDVELGAIADSRAEAPAGGFRPELVQTLGALRPGYLRDWQGQLADSPANRSAEPLARQPIRYRPGAHELQFAYSLPEFLALAAAVGARPWVILPATATPDEARAFGRALAQGWQRHQFDEIVVEHGNEHWNAVFRPAGLARAATLAEVADRAFAALREGAGAAVPLHRVLGTQYVDGAAAGRLARLSRHSDGVAVAPYFHYRQDSGETPERALDRALHEDLKPLQQALAEAGALGRAVDVYEVNFHTTGGSATPAERDAVLTAPASGTALARRLLQAAALGVQRQAVYTLASYDSFVAAEGRGDRRDLAQLFGITRDLAGAGHWRPTGAALVALNAVVGGTAAAADCTGPACGEITALAFDGGQRWAIVSAAAAPVSLRWPCTSDLAIEALAGPVPPLACRQGQATLLLPPRSWITSRARR